MEIQCEKLYCIEDGEDGREGGDQKNAKCPPGLSGNIIKQDGRPLWGLHQGQNSAIDEGFIIQLLSACPEPEFLNF
jgi:hypothetical protein